MSTAVSRLERPGLSGAVSAVSLGIALFAVGWVRHRNHWTGGFDLGIFDQALWQLSHGRDHISLVERHVFADHVSPVLLLFVPLYWIKASPVWLIGAQALALGATVLPMRALARDVHAPPWIAGALTACSAPLLAAATFDFHPSTLAVPFVATMVRFARSDVPKPATLAAVGVVLCRADLALVVLAGAVLAGARTRRPLLVVAVAAALASALIPGWFGATNGWIPHFGHLGSGPVDSVLHPWRAVEVISSEGALRPLITWILAAGVLVALRPRWLIAVVIGGLPVLLSRWGATELPWFHYGAPVAPIAIGGTLVALGHGTPPPTDAVASHHLLALVGVVIALVVASPLSTRAPDQFEIARVVSGPWKSGATDVVDEVGPDEAVSADNRLVPLLSQREQVFMYPLPFALVEGFFAPGSEPDLARYSPDEVDVIVIPSDALGAAIRDFVVVRRVGDFVILRRPDANMRSKVVRAR